MYLWIKAFHIIFMVAWFAGLFYIFRLFVYHVKFKDEAKLCEAYEVMEKKLIHIIMTPASVVTGFLGLWMLYLNPSLLKMHWMHAKLLGVVCLVLYHLYSIRIAKKFAKKDFILSEKACRMINEIPTLALFLVIIMVIVRPF